MTCLKRTCLVRMGHMNDQYHLEQVSRSFAVSIQALSEPLRDYIGLAYLLCRVVDTIEDSSWPNQQSQKNAFDQFESFLMNRSSLADFKLFSSAFPADVCREERELIDDSYQLFERYHALPTEIRACIQNPVLSMSRGMKFFIFRDFKTLKLRDLKELDQYCFFVAGVVGELLTNLANRISVKRLASDNSAPFSLIEAYHFALFLQKVNILKDKQNDEKNGRYLLPDPGSVWRQLENHSQHAFNYIEKIPKHLNDFKLFCSWALFLGLSSLSYLVTHNDGVNKGEQKSKAPKMSREQALDLFTQLKSIIAGGECLQSLYQNLKQDFLEKMQMVMLIKTKAHVPFESTLGDKTKTFSPVLEYYSGQLDKKDLAALNVLR
jgi:phytoene/squalene synthetase